MFDKIKDFFKSDPWRDIERQAKADKWEFVARLISAARGLADTALLALLNALIKLAIERNLKVPDGDS